jgi:hypothetical protein
MDAFTADAPRPQLFGLIEWLSGDECHELDDAGLGQGARAAGLQIRQSALPYGEVGAGNIGAGWRLDFTLVELDVNLVNRREGFRNDTGQP